MTVIHFENKEIALNEDESVLDALLRENFDIPHGCKAGACQSCVMRITSGTVPPQAQQGLKTAQKELGLFLSCSCKPKEDISISLAEQIGEKATTKVINVEKVNRDILQLTLQKPFACRAGQYINIWQSNDVIRSYSIASASSSETIVLHIKVLKDGIFSQWADQQLMPGDELTIQGPLGECIYTEDAKSQTLLLAGIGTGLAPLFGIIQDALMAGHERDIHLVLGAKTPSGFYYRQTLSNLANKHDNLHLHYVAQTGEQDDIQEGDIQEGDIYQYLKAQFPSTKDHRIYLCGAESFVRKAKKQCFLAGAAMKEIHADAFLPCG